MVTALRVEPGVLVLRLQPVSVHSGVWSLGHRLVPAPSGGCTPYLAPENSLVSSELVAVGA